MTQDSNSRQIQDRSKRFERDSRDAREVQKRFKRDVREIREIQERLKKKQNRFKMDSRKREIQEIGRKRARFKREIQERFKRERERKRKIQKRGREGQRERESRERERKKREREIQDRAIQERFKRDFPNDVRSQNFVLELAPRCTAELNQIADVPNCSSKGFISLPGSRGNRAGQQKLTRQVNLVTLAAFGSANSSRARLI